MTRPLSQILEANKWSLENMADVVRAQALTLEFYYYCRELIRSNHASRGLQPPAATIFPNLIS